MNKNAETREDRWNKREFALAERAEELGLELQQDNDGCYWLNIVDQPDAQSLGPFDLDEAEDRIVAAERGIYGGSAVEASASGI